MWNCEHPGPVPASNAIDLAWARTHGVKDFDCLKLLPESARLFRPWAFGLAVVFWHQARAFPA
jgi:hypothetical protein